MEVPDVLAAPWLVVLPRRRALAAVCHCHRDRNKLRRAIHGGERWVGDRVDVVVVLVRHDQDVAGSSLPPLRADERRGLGVAVHPISLSVPAVSPPAMTVQKGQTKLAGSYDRTSAEYLNAPTVL